MNCMFHAWEKWGETYVLPSAYGRPPQLAQDRECAKCGLVEQREVGPAPATQVQAYMTEAPE